MMKIQPGASFLHFRESSPFLSHLIFSSGFQDRILVSCRIGIVSIMNISLDSVRFSQHVSQILKRDIQQISLPPKPSNADVPDQELLQMTLTATESVKKEYINKQSVALEVILKRTEQLKRERDRQEQDLTKCMSEKKQLIDSITSLDEKYESTLAKQRELVERVEEVLRNVKRREPISDAEQRMTMELEVMRDRVTEYRNNLLVIQGKHVYQGAIMRKEKQQDDKSSSGRTQDPRVISSQLPNIKLMLENQ